MYSSLEETRRKLRADIDALGERAPDDQTFAEIAENETKLDEEPPAPVIEDNGAGTGAWPVEIAPLLSEPPLEATPISEPPTFSPEESILSEQPAITAEPPASGPMEIETTAPTVEYTTTDA